MILNITPATPLKYFTLSVITAVIIGGCSSSKPLNDTTTSATLWVQTAAEYEALTIMVYQSASSQLNNALNVPSWTAAVEQEQNSYRGLPPAVILDVDETVLDNSPFQARLIKQHQSYSTERWNNWVREQKAEAIDGALQFTKEAAEKGITVFYLTNREHAVEDATYGNLQKRGFPLSDEIDVLLTKNERKEWTSAKENRRKYIAGNYRIIMLFGDNLNDFLRVDNMSIEERSKLVDEHRNRFGTQWFVLPNPVYGSWQQALYDFDNSLNDKQIEELKLKRLDRKN